MMQGLSTAFVNAGDSRSTPSAANPIRTVATEGRSPLATGQTASGQVTASTPASEGSGYRVQVQLNSGEQLTLRLERPLASGQAVELQGRGEQRVDLRLPAAPETQARLQQQLNSLLAQQPAQSARPATSQNPPLNPGQTLIAQVSSSQTLPGTPAGSQASGSEYRLQLQLPQGQTLTLISERPLQPGQMLQVSRPDAGSGLQIKPLNPEALQLLNQLASFTPQTTSTPPREAASLQSLLQAASAQLRHALPRQAPLQQPLQQLSQLVRQLPAQSAPLPNNPLTTKPSPLTGSSPAAQALPKTQTAPVTQAVATQQTLATQQAPGPQPSLQEHLNRLLQLIPQGQKTPTAQQLQAFIPYSGLLLEANLLRGQQTGTQPSDLKLLLQQASAQLRNSGGGQTNAAQQQVQQQISQQLQTAQARIQVLQQSSLQATQASHERGQPVQVLQMDLPYSVRGDWFQAQLEIRRWIEEREAQSQAAEEKRPTRCWEVQLSFDLPQWGQMHTLLKLQNERLHADLWVEAESALEPVQKEAHLLEARLRRLGADVEGVNCHHGSPPQIKSHRPSEQMIDMEI